MSELKRTTIWYPVNIHRELQAIALMTNLPISHYTSKAITECVETIKAVMTDKERKYINNTIKGMSNK